MLESLTKREDAVVAARLAPASDASLTDAIVRKDFGALGVEVESGAETALARIAFSCLVQPIVGDRVLIARDGAGAFVLAVLERSAPHLATLSLPSRGALIFDAESIKLGAGRDVVIEAPSVAVRAAKFDVFADALTLFGRVAHWIADHINVSARTQETVADTLSVKALDRISIVERADVLQAASVSQTIDNVAVTSAPAVVIATTEDLRLDGKRVTVG